MKKVRIVSFLLTVVMVVACAFSAVVSVSAATSQSGDVVYFDNTITGYSQVYAYMWGSGGSNSNWPGELMTKVDGNIWGYTIKGSYDKVIFTNGNSDGQSDDLTYAGNGMLATPKDNGRFQVDWSQYKGNVTLPTSATVPSSENQENPSTPSQSGEYIIYCKNDKGWGNVNVYMWNSNEDTISSWPGKAMTDSGNGYFEFKYNKAYANAIFNNGSEQTGDMTIPAGKNCYNNATGLWEYYVPSSENPTNPTTPSESTPSQSSSNVIYCKNDKGWGNVNVYMWNSNEDTISPWPGKAMTDLSNGYFELKYDKAYANAIFNNGSEQTGDMTIPAGKNCYNNSTGQWDYYVPSDVQITKFATNRTNVCYVSCDVEISAEATSVNGAVTYKFSVADSGGEVVLSEGSANSAIWVPSKAGKYEIKVVVTDIKGESAEKTMEFTVGEASQLIAPYINTFYNSLGTKTEIKKNTNIAFTMNAIGGKTGTNLLFYKFEITEPDSAKNIPYYTTSNVYSYTPVKLGDYQIKVSVQGSDNTTVTETYNYKCVENLTENTTQTDKRGDVNGDGVTNVRDVTTLQMYLAKIIDIENKDVADINKNGRIEVRDVTYLQMVLCKIVDFK